MFGSCTVYPVQLVHVGRLVAVDEVEAAQVVGQRDRTAAVKIEGLPAAACILPDDLDLVEVVEKSHNRRGTFLFVKKNDEVLSHFPLLAERGYRAFRPEREAESRDRCRRSSPACSYRLDVRGSIR